MKTKILISLIILIGLIVGGFFVYQNFLQPVSEKEEEIYIYKGIWLPTLLIEDPNQIASKMQKFKDIGGNTVFIQSFPPQPEYWLERLQGRLPPVLLERGKEILPFEKELVIANIQTAHKNGLKVALTVAGFMPADTPKLEEIDLEALNSKIVEYAKLAEEYDVELFAPMNEPDQIFLEKTGEWRQEILHRIQEVYHGEIIWKGAGFGLPDKILSKEFLKEISEGPQGDFLGYDYIGFSSALGYPEGETLEEYAQEVENILKYVPALAERDNSKGVMITEFVILEGEHWSEEEIARAHEIVLEKGKGKVVGFFALDFLGGELPGMPLIKEDLKTKEVIRKYFTEVLK